MKRLMLAGAVLAAVGCASEPSAVIVHEHSSSAEPVTPSVIGSADPSTTTTDLIESPTTSITAPATTVATAPPTTRRATTTVYVPPAATNTPTVHDGDFWYRLATCESGNGRGSANQFQFMGGTAEKVGYYAGASYPEQVAMAQDWAARIHPNEGSTAGWPVCWWVAGGN